MAFIVLL
ncbi:60S ribosomal protein l15, partial [Phtheirospermum japonicum]